ncbi:RNA polymerase sigma factor [Deinococcus maricopensis]|uniref:RNA polymerase, sigma-24 subunit, ECF subfamily n=1 Tax=Deinococcus maricopensis (strain DSM 21211 / LMG 22137 / NRRL B-23946 / LB-34) TaxID=709986 RepID=E8UBJ5_DEIML|nr:sigma-70 family RNA polymerase sigma factor [Deinococcus maricopensis]ADV68434.1 RNA polymerase, sigma-24 subunit, ECF subfamily [Deinococcus maricopensis DSM 21211]
MTPTDEQLIAAIAARDEDALLELHRRYARYVYAMARRMLGPNGEHEEAVQDVFMSIWRAAERFDARLASAKTWLVTIAQRRMLQTLRDRSPETYAIEDWDAPSAQPDLEDRVMLDGAVQTLDAESQQLIDLAFYRGYSHSEVAALTGKPLGTVKTRIRQALTALRSQLERGRGGEVK